MKTVTYDETRFVLVPREPTDAMLVAGARCRTSRSLDEDDTLTPEYCAMIAAAPSEALQVPDETVPKLTQQQAIILTGYTGVLCCSSFGAFQHDLSQRAGRPVFTHEAPGMARPLYRADFLKLIPAAPFKGEPE